MYCVFKVKVEVAAPDLVDEASGVGSPRIDLDENWLREFLADIQIDPEFLREENGSSGSGGQVSYCNLFYFFVFYFICINLYIYIFCMYIFGLGMGRETRAWGIVLGEVIMTGGREIE